MLPKLDLLRIMNVAFLFLFACFFFFLLRYFLFSWFTVFRNFLIVSANRQGQDASNLKTVVFNDHFIIDSVFTTNSVSVFVSPHLKEYFD